MIKGYGSVHLFEPDEPSRFHIVPAVGAGLIAGAILLIVPHGSPWESLTFFSPIIMGRTIPGPLEMPLLLVWILHLVVSSLYGLTISRVVATLRWQRAFFTGALAGLVLYAISFGVVSALWPWLRGSEFSVVITHIVFGLITAGAYRGLLKRNRNVPAPAATSSR
jgi:LytS/YehU family sensor histidine kinase